MLTLLLATFSVLLFGGQMDGTCRAKNAAGFSLIRIGRLAVGLWSYRPGRIYYRLGVV